MHAHEKHRSLSLLALILAGAAGCRPPDAGRGDLAARAFLRIVAAEDVRPAGGPDLQVLVDAAHASMPALRGAAVRALGRLERPSVAPRIEESLGDPDPTVRGQAADALAQAYHGRDGGAAVFPLLRRIGVEADPWVRGVLARSLGRLRVEDARRREVERALLSLSRAPGSSWAPLEQLTGTTLGLYSWVRGGAGPPVGDAIIARLREIARYVPPKGEPDGDDGRVREVALMALSAASALSEADASTALDDADERVRRVGAAWLARPDRARPDLAQRALQDPAAPVRLEGVRALAAAQRDVVACADLESVATGDASVSVRLAALDALARPCPEGERQESTLEAVASALPAQRSGTWHAAAHALAALAALDPGRASGLLPRFAAHPNPFVRTWAARAATLIPAGTTLRTLARDPDANTRAEALDGLARVYGAGATSALVSALEEDDAPQVILSAASRLGGTDSTAAALDAALSALDRLGRTGAQTLRDPRLALVDLVGALGDATYVPALEPFLRDYDAAVASRAADVLGAWTGRPWLAAPRSPPRLPLPSPRDLRAMERTEVVLRMEGGGEVRIRLLPFTAPTNAFRLFEMARAEALDGLTFHRVVPNFVIQGGSPLANEYAGHGAYTRDEVGLAVQWRGTVGVSTRGRDTGDGQIYVNLVDNVRLDHDYTTLGVVVAGMDVVDGVQEGSVIERASIEPTR